MSCPMQTPIDPDISAIIEMAWDDDTSFEAIKAQTGKTEHQVIEIMRREMKPKSFRLWRRRVTGRASKHPKKML